VSGRDDVCNYRDQHRMILCLAIHGKWLKADARRARAIYLLRSPSSRVLALSPLPIASSHPPRTNIQSITPFHIRQYKQPRQHDASPSTPRDRYFG
jgi:hypothetical protein